MGFGKGTASSRAAKCLQEQGLQPLRVAYLALVAMNAKKNRKRVDHSGSSLDGLLEEEGIREEVRAAAIKPVLAWQLAVELRSTGQPRAAVPTKARKH